MKCVIYQTLPHQGGGPAAACVSIARGLAASGVETTLMLPRTTKPVNPAVHVVQTLPAVLRRLPWRVVSLVAGYFQNARFRAALGRFDPAETVLYFWPSPPVNLLKEAIDRGFHCWREMINSPVKRAREILDAAYAARNLPPLHGINDAHVAFEDEELPLYHRYVTCNDEVDRLLATMGILSDRIVAVTYGYGRDRFREEIADPRGPELRVAFVGTLCLRKGILDLLDAWVASGIQGRLILAGRIEADVAEQVAPFLQRPDIEHRGYVENVNSLFRSCDLFVFPSYEEGGPLVTCEAAACGLPLVTTPMGAARLLVDGVHGLVLPPGDVPALSAALQRLSQDHALRKRFSEAVKERSADFEYGLVSARRAALMRESLAASRLKGAST